MERALKRFSEKFDILIIGGGISGAAIAHEATLRGLKTALIERKDFGHATSAATSKMIHGGLRYLARMQLGVVRESLRERRLLLQNLPQQAFPLPFVFPVYKGEGTPSFLLNVGLTLYDVLSFDKNELDDPDKHLFNHQWLTPQQVKAMEPGIEQNNLKGAFFYYDVQNLHPHRANLAYVQSAVSRGAVVANYVSLQDFLVSQNGQSVEGVRAKDELNGQEFEIRAQVTVNATGPWGDLILARLKNKPVRKLIRSKGIHLLVPKINGDNAITMETQDKVTKEKKHFFILPWQGYTLLGTTDTPFEHDDPDALRVYRSEAEELLNLVTSYYPAKLSVDDVLHSYAGIRPLVQEGDSTESYTASRKHEIVDHKKLENLHGLVSVFGGKWTTSRSLAEETLQKILAIYPLKAKRASSHDEPLWGGDFNGRMSYYCNEARQKWSHRFPPELVNRLLEHYGTLYEEILENMQKDEKAYRLLDEKHSLYSGEIAYAVQQEMAVTLDDLLMRRIGLGNMGIPEESLLNKFADEMAALRGWSTEEKQKQIQTYIKNHTMVDDR